MSDLLTSEKRKIATPIDDVINPKKKFYIETLGCQMNVADSELIVSMLDGEGLIRSNNPNDYNAKKYCKVNT